ncbi:hypothetical protein RJT34_25871 [Clitoria ternatea]|uniref:non-specific serine/threonine protein kinase n=1 Tax=Clitoria ternatea TaxID=43366 RepID=A0AAN9FT73_CLITE
MSRFCSGVQGQDVGVNNNKRGKATSFSFHELALATGGFQHVNLIGEGGFGRVYKGRLSKGQVVAIKRLEGDGHQGDREFITEILMLSLLHHSNLVKLYGYCTHEEQRLLVYEYMPLGSLEHHLFDKKPLSWATRMKIAIGTALGIQYLHCEANPPLGPVGDNTHVSTRVMGTYGYCAPEYAMSGKLTLKSDIYCFGVVLLELITGRKAMDATRRPREQNLVSWCAPFLSDRRKFSQMVDPRMQGNYPLRLVHHAIDLTAMCLRWDPNSRPFIGDIVDALDYLASQSISDAYKNGLETDAN